MLFRNKFPLLSCMIVFTLILSAVMTVPVYADDNLPPVETPAVGPEEPSAQTGGGGVPDIGTIVDQPESVLAELPQDTQLIVLDENGETVPLATQAAAEAIEFHDPMWCPVGITPGSASCSIAYGSLKELFDDFADPLGATNFVPTGSGIIWIENAADASSADINVNGADPDFGTWEDFTLTLQGGWTGTGKTISGISTFSKSITISNWNGAITINNITISAATTPTGLFLITNGNVVLKNVNATSNSSNGVYIDTTNGNGTITISDGLFNGNSDVGIYATSKGNITLTNVIASGNGSMGARLLNIAGTGNVNITNSQFNNNPGVLGLWVETKGLITLKDIKASDNGGSHGALLDNSSAVSKAVTMSGTNIFTGNNGNGLRISSQSQVTLNNIIASNNGNIGLDINNSASTTAAAVKLTGTNTFNDNTSNGLSIQSKGAVSVNNVFANSNGGLGAYVINSSSDTPQAVTFTGTNEFKYNASTGLNITSKGAISLNNVSVISNTGTGAVLDNQAAGSAVSPVTLTGNNGFNNNFFTGLIVSSNGLVKLNNITANGNGTSNSSGDGLFVGNGNLLKGVTLTGTSSFNDNYATGLNIISSGPISLNNITANDSGSDGASLVNVNSTPTKPQSVILTGINFFNDNASNGLLITTHGAVTLNNIVATLNTQMGASISNEGSAVGQAVTIKGANTFSSNNSDGLHVSSRGNIVTNTINALTNAGYGVFLDNTLGSGNLTMTGTNVVNENTQQNMRLSSNGTILLNNITANSSLIGPGAVISNTGASTPKGITLTGTNSFNSNFGGGVNISSMGLITLNNITASGNGSNGGGAIINNQGSPVQAGVTLAGTNAFNDNSGKGLSIYSDGNIKTNSVTSNSNTNVGIDLNSDPNVSPTAAGSVTMTGTNIINENGSFNLYIDAIGSVTLNSIQASGSNNGMGVKIDNTFSGSTPMAVTLTGVNVFSDNAFGGLQIDSHGAITTNSLTAKNNGAFGVVLNNANASAPVNITLKGSNSFNSNSGNGLSVESLGTVTLSNVTANGNGNIGANIDTSYAGATGAVTVSGTNVFNSNSFGGLYIDANGAVTVNNITASNSANGSGMDITNTFAGTSSPRTVKITGTNVFNNNLNDSGLVVNSHGAITMNNITANLNSLSGATIQNHLAATAASVTLTGTNQFIDNGADGLYVNSKGAIAVNNVTASDNTTTGADLNNDAGVAGVMVSGTNTFSENGSVGLDISTTGAVSLTRITADRNNQQGVYINSGSSPVTLTCGSMVNNSMNGYYISTSALVTLKGVLTAGNGTANFVAGPTLETYGCPLP